MCSPANAPLIYDLFFHFKCVISQLAKKEKREMKRVSEKGKVLSADDEMAKLCNGKTKLVRRKITTTCRDIMNQRRFLEKTRRRTSHKEENYQFRVCFFRNHNDNEAATISGLIAEQFLLSSNAKRGKNVRGNEWHGQLNKHKTDTKLGLTCFSSAARFKVIT